jgi:hypothetical protein
VFSAPGVHEKAGALTVVTLEQLLLLHGEIGVKG